MNCQTSESDPLPWGEGLQKKNERGLGKAWEIFKRFDDHDGMDMAACLSFAIMKMLGIKPLKSSSRRTLRSGRNVQDVEEVGGGSEVRDGERGGEEGEDIRVAHAERIITVEQEGEKAIVKPTEKMHEILAKYGKAAGAILKWAAEEGVGLRHVNPVGKIISVLEKLRQIVKKKILGLPRSSASSSARE